MPAAEKATPYLTPVPEPRRVADVIIDTLRELGVDTFYGIPGGAISPIYDALLDAPDLRVINNRHETGALFIAAGHSLNGSLPVVLMTSGPGITNALTGLASAFVDGIPLVCIGGEVPKKNFGRGALQEGSKFELDIMGMVRSVTKYAAVVVNPRSASNVVRRAVATARSGRQGPVFLSLPLDVASERVMPTAMSSNVSTRFEDDDSLIDDAAEALQNCKHGLILIGAGARHPMAVTQVRILAETLQIPVATTPKGKGLFPERSKFALGVFGYGGHASATKYVESGPDVLLAIGCGLGETSTNSWNPALRSASTFIQVDIDSSQIGKNYHVDVGLVGPAHMVMQRIISKLRVRPRNLSLTGVEYHDPASRDDASVPLKPPYILRRLQQLVPPDTIFTSDIGEHLMFVLHYLEVNQFDGFQGHLGLGSMGSGIGSAIGAKIARPERPVVSICGDYGFQMYGMELATCVEAGVACVFAVLNDARMRMVEHGFERVYGRKLDAAGPQVDFAAMARAQGANAIVIEQPSDFDKIDHSIFFGDVPTVLDIRTDPNSAFAMSGRNKQISNFSGKG